MVYDWLFFLVLFFYCCEYVYIVLVVCHIQCVVQYMVGLDCCCVFEGVASGCLAAVDS